MAQREKEGTLKFATSYTETDAAKRGKVPVIAKTVTTTDVPTSEVIEDFETVNDKAVTDTRKDISIDFGIAADFDLLGKVVADLQEDVAASAAAIVGTLHYVTGYTGFSGDPDEQEGNYLAFMVSYDGAYTRLTVQGGIGTEVTLDSDRTHILRIVKANPVTIRAYNGDICVAAKRYTLEQLVLEEAE